MATMAEVAKVAACEEAMQDLVTKYGRQLVGHAWAKAQAPKQADPITEFYTDRNNGSHAALAK